MTYKKYLFCIQTTLLIGLMLILQPLFSVVHADNIGSGYTGASKYEFKTGMRIINPSTDLDKTINYISSVDDAGVRHTSPITVRDYLTKLASLDSSADLNRMESSNFFVMFTDLENGGASYILDGTIKDKNSWLDAARNGGLSEDQIAKVAQLYDSLIAKGVTIINGSTTYMYAGQGGGTDNLVGKPKLPPGFIGCDIGIGPKLVKTHTKDEDAGTITDAYSIYATLTPVKPQNFSKLSSEQQAEWERTHQSQTTKPIKTAFGKYLDSHRKELAEMKAFGKSGGIGKDSNYRKAWESFAAGAKAAAAQPLPDVKIDTSDANKEGMNKGGTFTYTEMVKDATVTSETGDIQHSQDYYDEYGCVNHEFTGSYNEYDNGKVTGTKTFKYTKSKYEKIKSDKMVDGNYTKTGIVVIEGHDYKPNLSWQFISVRCNQDGFNNIVASTGSTSIQSGKASSSAKSPVVNGKVATFYNGLGIDFFYTGKTCDRYSMACSA